MNVLSMRPAGRLRNYVYWFAYYSDFGAQDLGFRMLSEGTVDILIPLEGRTVVASGAAKGSAEATTEPLLIGPQQSFTMYDTSNCSRAFGIVFAPGGASKFLGPQIGEFTNSILSAQDVMGPGLGVLHNRLLDEQDPERMFTIVEAFLRRRLDSELRYAEEIEYAISAIRRGETAQVSLVEFAEKTIGFSHKHFVELFARQVGLTPKRFQRISHFNGMLECCRRSPQLSWRQLTPVFGYTDPSHLAKDFHKFAGMTPGEYLRSTWTHRQVLSESTK